MSAEHRHYERVLSGDAFISTTLTQVNTDLLAPRYLQVYIEVPAGGRAMCLRRLAYYCGRVAGVVSLTRTTAVQQLEVYRGTTRAFPVSHRPDLNLPLVVPAPLADPSALLAAVPRNGLRLRGADVKVRAAMATTPATGYTSVYEDVIPFERWHEVYSPPQYLPPGTKIIQHLVVPPQHEANVKVDWWEE